MANEKMILISDKAEGVESICRFEKPNYFGDEYFDVSESELTDGELDIDLWV